MEECNEIVEEVKIVGKNEDKRSSCILYIVLFSIFFTINIGTATYFVYYKYMNHNKENLSKPDYVYPGKKSLIQMGEVKQREIKNSNYYFDNDMINLKNFDSNLLTIDKKSYKNVGIYNNGYITIKKNDDYESIYSVNPLYLRVNYVNRYIEEKNGNKYLIFDTTDGKKELQN